MTGLFAEAAVAVFGGALAAGVETALVGVGIAIYNIFIEEEDM